MKDISKIIMLLVLGILFIPTISFSEDQGTSGISADIDNDGRQEIVQWRKFAGSELGSYYQLRVIDDDGRVLWAGPKEKNDSNPYVFSSLDIGISLPQILVDIDGDEYKELLAPLPQSDVSPTYYRKLSWRGTSFKKLTTGPLIMKDPGSDYFTWETGQHSYGIWVSKFIDATKDGLVVADITQYNSDGIWKGGVALLRFTPKGAVVERWLEPMKGSNENDTKTTEHIVKAESEKKSKVPFSNLNFEVSIKYTKRALHKLQAGNEKVKVWVILDQYGKQYVEEEGVASDEIIIDPGEKAVFHGLPLANSSYQYKSDKRYKLTIMVISARHTYPDNILNCWSKYGTEYDIKKLEGKRVEFECKLNE